MKTGRGMLVGALVFVIGAGVLGFTATKTGLIDRLGAVYSSWSLNSRVEALWEVRIQGDLEGTREFVVDVPNRVRLGTSVRYFSYEIKDVIIEGDQATVILDIEYRIAVPGFFSESDPPVKTESVQHWVRDGRTWYWDPGASSLDEDDPAETEQDTAGTPEDQDNQ